MSFSSTAVKIGVTLTVFKSSGKITSTKDNVKIFNKGLLEDPKQFLVTLKLFHHNLEFYLFAEKIMLLLIRLY